jgi:hypothetical protein
MCEDRRDSRNACLTYLSHMHFIAFTLMPSINFNGRMLTFADGDGKV